MKLKWIWAYISTYISLVNLIFYRENSKSATKLLKRELELAKLYPQYVFIDKHVVLLHNHTFWTANEFYMSAINYPADIVTYYIEREKNTYLSIKCYDNDQRPSFHMRIQLRIFIDEYLAGKYN